MNGSDNPCVQGSGEDGRDTCKVTYSAWQDDGDGDGDAWMTALTWLLLVGLEWDDNSIRTRRK